MTAVPVTGLVPAMNMLPMTAGQLMPAAAYGQDWTAAAAAATAAANSEAAGASPASSASPPAAGQASSEAGEADKNEFLIKDLQAEKDSLEASTDDTLQKANTIKLLEQGKK